MARPWHFIIPAIAVAVATLPSLTMVVLTRRLHIARSEEHPFTRSARFDGEQEVRARLAAGGFTCTMSVAGERLTARTTGPSPGALRVILVRPDDPSADRAVGWPDPRIPLAVDLTRPGRWRVLVEGSVSGVPARLAEQVVEAGG